MAGAQHASCAHPSGVTSSRAGTLPVCGARCKCSNAMTTLLRSAPFGSLDHINAQVRQAVESSSELRQAILRLCSPDSARMSPNLPSIHASKETEWTTHCWPCLNPNFAPPSARPWLGTCGTTVGGRPPLASCSVDSASAQHSPATGAPLPLLQRACDRRTEDAVLSLVSTLPPNSEALLLQQLTKASVGLRVTFC